MLRVSHHIITTILSLANLCMKPFLPVIHRQIAIAHFALFDNSVGDPITQPPITHDFT